MDLIADKRECFEQALALMRGGPFFLNRIGGSDTNSVALYLFLKSKVEQLDSYEMRNKKRLAEEKNGYYDFSGRYENYLRYCQVLMEAYEQSKHLLFSNYQLISMYFPSALPREQSFPRIENEIELQTLIEALSRKEGQLRCYPYSFVENILLNEFTLFRVFESELEKKAVLVISPFAKSIQANFSNKREFFKNYTYPNFELRLINTPITYSGLPRHFYPHESWFETSEWLKEEVSKTDFDVALLACGSYAMPIGLHIEQKLNKQAVYVGGVLQLFFGVMGRRYAGPFVQQQINPESFVWPLEREEFGKYVNVSEDSPKESFGAYF